MEVAANARGFWPATETSENVSRWPLHSRFHFRPTNHHPLQIHALREYSDRRGWNIVMQVREVGSGAAQRQAREKLLESARRREIDVVLVWRLDRWGRIDTTAQDKR